MAFRISLVLRDLDFHSWIAVRFGANFPDTSP
jgi:hypothetical protein